MIDIDALPPVLRAEEVAEVLCISPWSVYEHVRIGDFPVIPIRVGRALRFPRASVLAVLGISGGDS
jgi:predicted DNA-binding transcriptional regulator AlpA